MHVCVCVCVYIYTLCVCVCVYIVCVCLCVYIVCVCVCVQAAFLSELEEEGQFSLSQAEQSTKGAVLENQLDIKVVTEGLPHVYVLPRPTNCITIRP